MAIPSYDGPSAAASVVMSPHVRLKPILFVEGSTEVLLMSHHFPEYEDQVISCGGHAGVKEAIEVLESWEEKNATALRMLGLIDKDYGVASKRKRITTTSNRDLEIDIYETKAGERLLREKASRVKCVDPRRSISEVLSELMPVGLVRLYSTVYKCAWKINCINLEVCVKIDGSLDFDKFLMMLARENKISQGDMTVLKDYLAGARAMRPQLVTRGHDISVVLGKWLRRKIGNRTADETNWGVLEENLRLATSLSELLRYHWFRRIKTHFSGN